MAHAPSNHVDPEARTAPERGGVLSLGLLSIAVGAWTGLVVAVFRLGLAAADRLRGAFLNASHGWPGIGLVAVVCAGAGVAALAAWLARRFSPYAAGSGIPEVEVALQGELPPTPLLRLLLVKFVGGLLAIGGGMALGPEGPSVQMGAVGARLIGSRFRRGWPETRSLIAAGTGTGLAVAFNAPIAGVFFALELILRDFQTRSFGIVVLSSVVATAVGRLAFGSGAFLVHPHFHLVSAAEYPLYAVLGLLAAPAAAQASLAGCVNWNRLGRAAHQISENHIRFTGRVEIVCDRPMPLHADGEDMGDVEEALFEAERSAVEVLV